VDRLGASPVFATMESNARNLKLRSFLQYSSPFSASAFLSLAAHDTLRNGLSLPSALVLSTGQQCLVLHWNSILDFPKTSSLNLIQLPICPVVITRILTSEYRSITTISSWTEAKNILVAISCAGRSMNLIRNRASLNVRILWGGRVKNGLLTWPF
jgi:hypothetical protein